MLKSKKCNFYVDKVVFFSYVVITAGLAMDLKKIKAIIEWSGLINIKEI